MPWFWQEPVTPHKTITTDSSLASRNNSITSDNRTARPWYSPAHLIHPSTIISAALLTTAVVFGQSVYKSHLRRIPNVSHIKPTQFRTRSVFGRVTSVGDADNFRLYHTPGGRLLGWNWAREVPSERKELVDQTLHIRIAGIDAPELPHFGHPGQKYGPPAMDWLKKQVDGRDVRAYPYARDQYGRVVASVKIRRWWGIAGLGHKDLGLEMLKAGWAEVYVAKGAEYGKMKQAYLDAEQWARNHKMGQWSEQLSIWEKYFAPGGKGSSVKEESPRDFKSRMAREDAADLKKDEAPRPAHKKDETPRGAHKKDETSKGAYKKDDILKGAQKREKKDDPMKRKEA